MFAYVHVTIRDHAQDDENVIIQHKWRYVWIESISERGIYYNNIIVLKVEIMNSNGHPEGHGEY